MIDAFSSLKRKRKLYSTFETKKLSLNYIETSKVALAHKSDKIKVEKYIQYKEKNMASISITIPSTKTEDVAYHKFLKE